VITQLRPRDQQLAREVLAILVGCDLIETGDSISGGKNFYFPKVVDVVDGPPKGLIIGILPGQHPDDFTAKAKTIAYNLGMTNVTVVPLGPYRIRLDLEP
jgi:hypothetical protein